MSAVATRTDTWVTVRCQCGDHFEITSRSHRRHRQAGTEWRCFICRVRSRTISDSPRFQNYWLDRYPIEWIRETAEMIWGDAD